MALHKNGLFQISEADCFEAIDMLIDMRRQGGIKLYVNEPRTCGF